MENNKNKVNPAMLTISEYLKLVNQDGMMHPESAYQISVESMNTYLKASDYTDLSNSFYANGILFQLKAKKYDRWADSYVKNNENGEPVFDKMGKAVKLNAEEIKTLIPERYHYFDAVIDVKENKVVGYTEREWGALLVAVAKEYQGFGIGSILHHKHRSRYPDVDSGGMTPSGKASLMRAHQRMVSLALQNGEYRKAYLDGSMTYDRANKIIGSALITKDHVNNRISTLVDQGFSEDLAKEVTPSYKRPSVVKHINLDFSKKENWLLHINGNYAILYDKAMLKLLKTDDKYEYFHEKGILGYAYVGGSLPGDTPILSRVYGQTPEIKSSMIEAIFNENLSSPIKVSSYEAIDLKEKFGDKVKLSPARGSRLTEATLEEPTIDNLAKVKFIEEGVRRALDSFDESFTLIHEMAYSIAEAEHQEKLDKRDNDIGMSF